MIYYSAESERVLARGRLLAGGAQFALGVIGGLLFTIAWRVV